MKTYFTYIRYLQEILLAVSIGILAILPLVFVFRTPPLSDATVQMFYAVSHWSLFFVMMIRPLADIFVGVPWLRPLVILRKGVGVLSASIIVSFIIAKLITIPGVYVASLGTKAYWSLGHYALFAHAADLSAIVLLVTSNNFSKRVLGTWWKRVQKLSYVYFYGSALYVYFTYNDVHQLIALIAVTFVTTLAFLRNKSRATQKTI